MKVTEQIDALEATAVDSFKSLVVTRMVACVVALPILTTVMNGAKEIVGGYLCRGIAGPHLTTVVPRSRLLARRLQADLVRRRSKPQSLASSSPSSSFLGMTTTQGTEGVGRASTRSVVMSSVVLIVVNVVPGHNLLLFPEERVAQMPDAAIRFEGVTKSFGDRRVLDDVSFEIPRRTAFCLLGRSGTDKTSPFATSSA